MADPARDSRPPQWVGRTQELAILRAGAKALHGGEGAVVWVEGEPGIGIRAGAALKQH